MTTRGLRRPSFAAVAGATLAGHAVPSGGPALAVGAVWALGVGSLLWSALPVRLRPLGPLACLLELAALVAGGLLAEAGLAHALLYGALLAVFGASLRRGGTAVITRLARRLNPHFRAGMIPYTRKVTWAWCLFAALQLAASGALLAAGALGPWRLLVEWLHVPMALLLMLAEFALRCRRFPGEHVSLAATLRGMRAATGTPP